MAFFMAMSVIISVIMPVSITIIAFMIFRLAAVAYHHHIAGAAAVAYIPVVVHRMPSPRLGIIYHYFMYAVQIYRAW